MLKGQSKRIITFNKTARQILQQKIEAYLEDYGEFEFLYIEVKLPKFEETLTKFISKNDLASILSKDITCDYHKLISEWPKCLVPYIFHNLQIDFSSNTVSVINRGDMTNLIAK